MAKCVFLLVALLSLSACGGRQHGLVALTHGLTDQTVRPIDDGSQAKIVGEVCYPGADASGRTCLGLVDAHVAAQAGYRYPDVPSNFDNYEPPSRFVDLNLVDAHLALSPHFASAELMPKRNGAYSVFSTYVLDRLESMRETSAGPIKIHSGFRSPVRNAGVKGSAKYSRHMYGDAVDISIPGMKISDVAKLCQPRSEVFIKIYRTHVHCDWRKKGLDLAFYDPIGTGVGIYALTVGGSEKTLAVEEDFEEDEAGLFDEESENHE